MADSTITGLSAATLPLVGNELFACDQSSTTVNVSAAQLNGGYQPSTVIVSGSDFTTTSTSLVNVTGLSLALAASSTYQFESLLFGLSSSAAGLGVGANFTGTGSPTCAFFVTGGTSGTGTVIGFLTAFNSPGTGFLIASNQLGPLWMKGFVKTDTGGANLVIQALKTTSGTATIKIGSSLTVWKMA
jgi:hypothetical protein